MITLNDVEYELKLKGAATPEELLKLAKEKGYELSEGQLGTVSDLSDWSCPLHDDRPCPDNFYCIRHSG